MSLSYEIRCRVEIYLNREPLKTERKKPNAQLSKLPGADISAPYNPVNLMTLVIGRVRFFTSPQSLNPGRRGQWPRPTVVIAEQKEHLPLWQVLSLLSYLIHRSPWGSGTASARNRGTYPPDSSRPSSPAFQRTWRDLRSRQPGHRGGGPRSYKAGPDRWHH